LDYKILGIASFIHYLRCFKKEFFLGLVNEKYYLCVQVLSQHTFPLTIKEGKSLDCGFIQADNKALSRLFSIDELRTVLDNCEKNGNIHCPISKNPNKRGNIPTIVDGKEFNCYLSKN